MQVDESGAPWPYDPVEPAADDEGKPTWECPGGSCDCHAPQGGAELEDHKVLFFDGGAKKMGGARCRVIEDGKLLNKEAPYADGSGGVAVKIRPGSRVLELEWAPASLPEGPGYPYRKQYYIDLGEAAEDGVRRRLHNIGFSHHGALTDNVKDYQRTYLHKETGRHEDIAFELAGFHDNGTLPPVPKGGGQAQPATRSSLVGDDAAGASPAGAPGGGTATGGKKDKGSAAPLGNTKLMVHVRYRSGRDLRGDKSKDEQVDVTIDSGPFNQTKQTDLKGFATFTLTQDDFDKTQPPGWVTVKVSRRHHGPDLGPGHYGLVSRPVAKEFNASLKLDPPTFALDQPLMLPAHEANILIKGKDRYLDVVLIDAALARGVSTPGTPARRLDGKQIQGELMEAHVDGDITMSKDFDFEFDHDTSSGRFAACTDKCKVRAPKVDRWVAIKSTIAGVTWYDLLALKNVLEDPKDKPVTLRYLRDNYGYGRKKVISQIDQRLVVGLLRICRDLHLRFNIVSAFTQGMEGGGVNKKGEKRTDAHGYGLAVDFGALSTEAPDVVKKNAAGVENRAVKLEVDFVVLYHWGRIEMWDPKLVKQNPDDQSKWKRIKDAEADKIDYTTDPDAKKMKLHYRLDPAPLQDDPPDGAPEELKKLPQHFRTAQLLFKAIYDNSVEQLSDSNGVLGPTTAVTDTKTEIDANVPHITLHPDYGKPNNDGRDDNGRQAHQNHFHFQLGLNNNGGIVRTQ